MGDVDTPLLCSASVIHLDFEEDRLVHSHEHTSKFDAWSKRNPSKSGKKPVGTARSLQERRNQPTNSSNLSPNSSVQDQCSFPKKCISGRFSEIDSMTLPDVEVVSRDLTPSPTTSNLQFRALTEPNMICWKPNTEKVILHPTDNKSKPVSVLGFEFQVTQTKDPMELFILVKLVTDPPALGRLQVGDWIRSINSHPLQDPMDVKWLQDKFNDQVIIVIQRPESLLPQSTSMKPVSATHERSAPPAPPRTKHTKRDVSKKKRMYQNVENLSDCVSDKNSFELKDLSFPVANDTGKGAKEKPYGHNKFNFFTADPAEQQPLLNQSMPLCVGTDSEGHGLLANSQERSQSDSCLHGQKLEEVGGNNCSGYAGASAISTQQTMGQNAGGVGGSIVNVDKLIQCALEDISELDPSEMHHVQVVLLHFGDSYSSNTHSLLGQILDVPVVREFVTGIFLVSKSGDQLSCVPAKKYFRITSAAGKNVVDDYSLEDFVIALKCARLLQQNKVVAVVKQAIITKLKVCSEEGRRLHELNGASPELIAAFLSSPIPSDAQIIQLQLLCVPVDQNQAHNVNFPRKPNTVVVAPIREIAPQGNDKPIDRYVGQLLVKLQGHCGVEIPVILLTSSQNNNHYSATLHPYPESSPDPPSPIISNTVGANPHSPVPNSAMTTRLLGDRDSAATDLTPEQPPAKHAPVSATTSSSSLEVVLWESIAKLLSYI